jgi:hypothetical protein
MCHPLRVACICPSKQHTPSFILVCHGAVRQSVRRLITRFTREPAKSSKFDAISIASCGEVYYNAKRASSTDKGGKVD